MDRMMLTLFTWNTALRIGGLLGIAHETLIKDIDRPTLLLVFVAMMGLPAFIKPQPPS